MYSLSLGVLFHLNFTYAKKCIFYCVVIMTKSILGLARLAETNENLYKIWHQHAECAKNTHIRYAKRSDGSGGATY